MRSAWDSIVVESGLGASLEVREDGAGDVIAHARVHPFLPLPTLSAALRAAYAGRALARTTAEEMALFAADARMYEASYGMHVVEAQRRGWIAQPLLLGFFPSVLLGAGHHAHILAMNLPAAVSAPLTLAGVNKAVGRDLLVMHELPVAPGGLAASPAAALRIARRLGGPVVIKRLIGGNSDGVITGLHNARDITSAARLLLATGHAVLVESMCRGTELRLHFLAGRLHRAFRAAPYTITGDGHSTLTELIAAAYPRYLAVMTASTTHRRRLVMCLWAQGVRKAGDLARVVPTAGDVIRISAATGAGMQRVAPGDFLHPREIRRIEEFLAQHGAPSCGIDIIVRERGAFLETGAILEVNVPCGFAYLDEPARAVASDLAAAIAGDATFRRDKGRVPVHIVMDADGPRLSRLVEQRLRARYGNVAVGTLALARSNWPALLNQPEARALLIVVSEAAVLAHGMPANLAPLLRYDGSAAEVRRTNPLTYSTVMHAKGRIVRLS